ARHQLEAALFRTDDEGLQQPVGRDRSGQFLQRLLVEAGARLKRRRDDGVDRNLAQLLFHRRTRRLARRAFLLAFHARGSPPQQSSETQRCLTASWRSVESLLGKRRGSCRSAQRGITPPPRSFPPRRCSAAPRPSEGPAARPEPPGPLRRAAPAPPPPVLPPRPVPS